VRAVWRIRTRFVPSLRWLEFLILSTGEQYRWVKRKVRNEALDCTVYAMFAAHALDLHKYTESQWQRLQVIIQPDNGDLFSGTQAFQVPAIPPQTVPAQADPAEQIRFTEFDGNITCVPNEAFRRNEPKAS